MKRERERKSPEERKELPFSGKGKIKKISHYREVLASEEVDEMLKDFEIHQTNDDSKGSSSDGAIDNADLI